MALVESIRIPRGMRLPSFTLKDPMGKSFVSEKMKFSNGFLVVFTCNHCPYAIALWSRLIVLIEEVRGKGIMSVAINPNIHPDYPEDSAESMKKKIEEYSISFPYLIDESQEIAKAFKAQCTPDIYLFDSKSLLFYHGRFDDNWKREDSVSKEDLKEAIRDLLENKPLSNPMVPSMGCSIKWK